jgi:hypothetical protein
MPSNRAKWNLWRRAAVEIRGSSAFIGLTQNPRRVGFERGFGVKLRNYGLGKVICCRILTAVSASNSWQKLLRRVKPPKVMHITLIDPECILVFKSGLGLLKWHPASGFSLR